MATAVGLLAALIAGAITWIVMQPPPLDRTSYGGGWGYVVGRQFEAGWTDPEATAACTVYSDGFAQLDGYPDGQAFLQGCRDAIAKTSGEIGAEVHRG